MIEYNEERPPDSLEGPTPQKLMDEKPGYFQIIYLTEKATPRSNLVIELRIEYLSDHEEAIPTLARWHNEQWTTLYPDLSYDDSISRIRARIGRRQIPTSFVAFLEGKVVGVASLVEHDLETRMDLSPWLASVLVGKQYRRRGIGSILCERVAEEARSIGVGSLFLFTFHNESMYSRLGWSFFERGLYRGEQVCIMKRKLDTRRVRGPGC